MPTNLSNRNRAWRTLAALFAICLSPGGFAARSDKDKPVNLEADKVSVDDKNKVHVFEGRVMLTQGSLSITGERIVVRQDAEGFQKGVAYGNPARFRQKREDRDEWIVGEAERIEHDTKTERTQFFNRAVVTSGQDEVRGQYIQYDGLTEQYLVTGAPEGSLAKPAPGRDGRVRAVIRPRGKDGAQTETSPAAPERPGADNPK